MGLGKGKGGDQTTNVVAGSCCAICCGVCFLVVGLPMLIAGIVMVQIYKGQYDDKINAEINDEDINFDSDDLDDAKEILYKVGIALIVISVVCVVVGIIMVVLLCTGCCGRNTSNNAPTTMVVTSQQQQQYAVQPVAQPGYYPSQPGYDKQVQPGYDQQQGYYPNNQQAYPMKS